MKRQCLWMGSNEKELGSLQFLNSQFNSFQCMYNIITRGAVQFLLKRWIYYDLYKLRKLKVKIYLQNETKETGKWGQAYLLFLAAAGRKGKGRFSCRPLLTRPWEPAILQIYREISMRLSFECWLSIEIVGVIRGEDQRLKVKGWSAKVSCYILKMLDRTLPIAMESLILNTSNQRRPKDSKWEWRDTVPGIKRRPLWQNS